MAPIIGITADIHENRHRLGAGYAKAITAAGGIPVILPPVAGMEEHFVNLCDGFVFSGGDDPLMEPFGMETHPKATPVSKVRQTFELALLTLLQNEPAKPVFGVCLGMQWMGLLAGGTLNQHLEGSSGELHKTGTHQIKGELGDGLVHTHHHQVLEHAGSLEVIAVSEDGVIEAIADKEKPWYVGVQWHPERTEQNTLGQVLFNDFVTAASTNKNT